jgi:hypothetical protein
MGMMTSVTILNDGWHAIKQHPDQFIQNIEKGMSNWRTSVEDYPVGNYANPMQVHRSVHADIPQLLLLYQNSTLDLGDDIEDHDIAYFKRCISVAESIIEDAKAAIKKKERQANG